MTGPLTDVGVNVSELDEHLATLGKRGFLWHGFDVDKNGPELIAFTHGWEHCTDVMIMFDGERAVAYRTPVGPGIDVFAPEKVYWLYVGSPEWTIRALLALPPPDDAPATLIDAPRDLGLPVEARASVRIRRRGLNAH